MAKAKKSESNELLIARKEISFQKKENEKLASALAIAKKELALQKVEKGKRAAELGIANIELAFQDDEKGKRAAELGIANKEKGKRAAELGIANIELAFQNDEKEKRAAELGIANKEKGKRAAELGIANIELAFQNDEKEKRAAELGIANKEKGKRAAELGIANKKLVFQTAEKADQKRITTELNEAKIFAELATGIAEEAKIKAEKATQIAEDAVKAKQQFLSNMSHEIRTPMNAIIGFTKVLLKTDLSTKQKEYLTAIKLSGDALIVLINDILDLAKVDSGKMSFEMTPFKMASSLASMLHLFETKIQEKNLTLIKEYDSRIPGVLVGDPVRLHQIILNLLSNAVKFTSHGKITVAVNLLNEDEERATVEFAVSDTGIGIDPTKIEKIFETFRQASSGTARLYGGTGLGLAIVKQLVEAQDGTIQVRSKIGEGSTFSFKLSFLKTKALAESETSLVALDKEFKDIKVLVVEDIALNQLLMKTLLDDFGFERDIADNGRIAIEKLQAKSYDVILMDLQMPEMNGFETTEYIRNKMHSKIPIIALTADVTTVDLAKCKAVGMNDYIAKPVDERLLYTKIVGLVKKSVFITHTEPSKKTNGQTHKLRCIDMAYIIRLTKSNPTLMMEMISLYLKQTPTLISSMKQSLLDKDWETLYSATHKIIPSFSVVGISADFENMAKKIQEYASNQQQTDGIPGLVQQLESVCAQACKELEEEFNTIKNANS